MIDYQMEIEGIGGWDNPKRKTIMDRFSLCSVQIGKDYVYA
jgi:hypothetical protein